MDAIEAVERAPGGASFFRSDLHIHSYGGSHDVTDPGMAPDSIVATSIREGLSLVALTDHNDVTNVPKALAVAEKTDLLVVPGVELSTPQGHLLVYFRTLGDLQDYFGKLSIVGRGTSTSRCQTSMLDCLNLIDPEKGLAILAHVDGGGGLEELVPGAPPHKLDLLAHRNLLGIELRSATSEISYSDSDPEQARAQLGLQRQKTRGAGPGYYLARVLFSDSHTLAALGRNAKGDRRVTRLKMDAPSFDGFRIALLEPDSRVRIEDLVPESLPHVLGLHFAGGFLGDQVIRFSQNLNCIIGGRGAGKSTVFEAVRSVALGSECGDVVDSDVWPDELHAVWADEAGDTHAVLRRKGEDPQPVGRKARIRGFPTECYGQGETSSTSRRAATDSLALLEYLDGLVDVSTLQEEQGIVRDELLENQADIEKADLEVAKIPQFEQLLITTRQKLDALEKAKAQEVVTLERQVAAERGLRMRIEEAVGEIVNRLDHGEALERLASIRAIAQTETLALGKDEFRNIDDLAGRLQGTLQSDDLAIASEGRIFGRDVRRELTGWKAKEAEPLQEIEQKRRELSAKGIKLDVAYIRKLANDEASYKKTLTALKEWKKELTRLQKDRLHLLGRYRDVRSRMAAKREAYGRRASAALAGLVGDLSVSLKFVADGLSPEAEDVVQRAMGWRTIQVPRAALLVRKLTVPRLLDAIRQNDPRPIAALQAADKSRPFSTADAREIIERLRVLPWLHELERCLLEDRPRLTVTKPVVVKGQAKVLSKDFAKLSLGQQQSVLLSLMLCSDSTAPLVIDQPEDNLDSEFVYRSLVPVLRRIKERRQIILVTHNPNIVVLGDAEQIIVLKSLGDRSQIVAQGSIDDLTTRRMVCDVLEGARDAFKRRATIYGVISSG